MRFVEKEMINTSTRATRRLELPRSKKIRIFRDKTKSEREERKKLIDQTIRENNEEENQDCKWAVDYKEKKVVRVLKVGGGRMTFRQRKYR